METNNLEMRAKARKKLVKNWLVAVAVAATYLAIAVAVKSAALFSIIGTITALLVLPVMAYGLIATFLRFFRGEPLQIVNLFAGFREYGRVWGTMLLTYVYTALWSLLLLVPGIVKSYSYAMTPYLLHDNPALRGNAAIRRSREMMNGFKRKLFVMDLSFIGWGLLCLLTAGIGFIWLIPYMQTSRAAFYEEVRYAYELKVYHEELARYYEELALAA